jgi:hypothetical protein
MRAKELVEKANASRGYSQQDAQCRIFLQAQVIEKYTG